MQYLAKVNGEMIGTTSLNRKPKRMRHCGVFGISLKKAWWGSGAAVGIKAPSLYNHFSGKRAIFDAIVESVAAQYEADTDKINIHVQNVTADIPAFSGITEEMLFEKARQIFEYSLHNETVRQFRRMMTFEQFRSPELAQLYSWRYVNRVLDYHAGIFRALIASGEIAAGDPDTLAMMYVAPVLTLIGICDRQPEKEEECLEKLACHVRLFFCPVHGNVSGRSDDNYE